MDELAITVRGLHKTYGTIKAVDGIDLEVHRGEIPDLAVRRPSLEDIYLTMIGEQEGEDA